jgi:hypothetical protein
MILDNRAVNFADAWSDLGSTPLDCANTEPISAVTTGAGCR